MKRPLARALGLVFVASIALAPPVAGAEAPESATAVTACVGTVTSTLAVGGYDLASLATRSGSRVRTLSQGIQAGCAAGTPAVQITGQVLHDADYGPGAIAGLLATGFSSSPAATAGTLHDLGYGSVAIAQALIDVYGLYPPRTVPLLVQLGFNMSAVGLALRDAHAEPIGATAWYLIGAFGWEGLPETLTELYPGRLPELPTPPEPLVRLQSIGDESWEEIKHAFKAFGEALADFVTIGKDTICEELTKSDLPSPCSGEFWTWGNVWAWVWDDVSGYWKDCWHPGSIWEMPGTEPEDWACDAVFLAGVFYREIGVPVYEWAIHADEWAENAYFSTRSWLAERLHDAGYAADVVVGVLKDSYASTETWVVEAYHRVGYAADEVADALKDAYAVSAGWATQALKDVGYAADEVADAAKDIFGATREWVVGALHTVGYAADEVADAMKDAYGASGEWVAQALKDVGYAADEVADALQDAYGWTMDQTEDFFDDVADWFCGWFPC